MSPVLGFIQMPQGAELLLVLLLVLIFFGAGKLPQVFGQFGKAVKSFKDGQKEDPDSEPAALPDPQDVMHAQVVSETTSEHVPK